MWGDLATALPRALAHRRRATLARPDKTVAAVLVPVFLVGDEPRDVLGETAHEIRPIPPLEDDLVVAHQGDVAGHRSRHTTGEC